MKLMLFDIGLPMIIPEMFLMIPALLPIILVEAYSLKRSLDLPLGKVLAASTGANVASTLIGIPITWFLLAVLEITTGGGSAFGVNTTWKNVIAVTWQAPWLYPNDKSDGSWIVFAAMITLLVPFFFASWYLECWISRPYLRRAIHENNQIDSKSGEEVMFIEDMLISESITAAWKTANLVSYGLLGAFLSVMLLISVFR